MRITFFAAKSYDMDSFNKIKDQYPELELEYWETELSPKTASYVRFLLRLRPTYRTARQFVRSSAPMSAQRR